jgi:hypothetical protein
MMFGWVVGVGAMVPEVARCADEGDDGAGVVAAAGGAVATGSSLGVTSGATAGTVVGGVLGGVLDAATPASTPTPATPPAAMIRVRLPTRAHPASRLAGVRGLLVTPASLAEPRKSWAAGW